MSVTVAVCEGASLDISRQQMREQQWLEEEVEKSMAASLLNGCLRQREKLTCIKSTLEV